MNEIETFYYHSPWRNWIKPVWSHILHFGKGEERERGVLILSENLRSAEYCGQKQNYEKFGFHEEGQFKFRDGQLEYQSAKLWEQERANYFS